ncbi:tetratricopeptide repeat protein [Bacteroides timonensis]|uniref:tetratricopeptide repeat protein n=1 Tax=Bacteroides timonensis TaxID=1470345 RepID=UPI0004AF5738|nr:tetratricopeptide repeat protein [Bacteroides timonensis]
MDRTYLLDEITKIRRVIIEKSGKFTLKECESIAAALEVDNVSLVAMLEAIRKDLFPQKFVLNLKDAERFQLLRSTLQKNVEHVILKKIAPELAILAENFKKPQADSEVCQQAINKLRIQIKPYAEKVPKLVKYLNEYADLCEANFLNVLRLKVLRINLRFLPLLKEANDLFDTCDNTSDKELYWKMAEQLYLNFPSLFKEEVYYFSIIRGILDAFYRKSGQEPIVLDIPAEISLIEEGQPEEVEAIEEKTEEVLEGIEEVVLEESVPVAASVDIQEEEMEEKNTEIADELVEPAIEQTEPEIEQVEPEIESVESEPAEVVSEPTEAKPELVEAKSEPTEDKPELAEADVKQVEPEVVQAEPEMKQSEPVVVESNQPEIKSPEPEVKHPDPERKEEAPAIQKKSRKSLYILGCCIFLILVLICLYFVFASKPKPVVVPPAVVADTITVVQDTTTVVPVATPEETPVKAVEQQKQPKVEEQPQPKAQPEAKTPVNEPQQQAEPEKTEKKAQTNSLEAAREATQNGDYKKAFDIYKSLANAGNAEAQYCLGIMYETGKGVDIDIFEAVMWYRKAKAKGFSMAERKLLELGYN